VGHGRKVAIVQARIGLLDGIADAVRRIEKR
jgi:hypothetical protein